MFGSSPQQRQQKCSESSESLSWDVFLSFYGKDTRGSFISHLYYALDQAGIVTFKDDPALDKGEEISSGLLKAIEISKMFVVVISENYARSSWCLDELVEVLRCKRTQHQVVPVFYYVHPSDVRHQKGCFGDALKTHMERYSVHRIDKWKSALTEIADLSGYHLEKDAKESEADIIQNIMENVETHTSTKVLHLEKRLFGIDLAVNEIYHTLSMESNDVRALGICGIGGIGKTTLAKALFNKYYHKFDISCFMENVKQISQGGSPLLPLLQQLLIELLRKKDYKAHDVESALRKLKGILSSKKALIVLDDWDQSSYSELLARICKLFSDGSRVIITARDANLPHQLKVEMRNVYVYPYLVEHLDNNDSLELFSYHAFKKPTPPMDYKPLSESFVTYTRGLPLALKVLGSSLCGRTNVSFWKVKLEKVKKIPVADIQTILQIMNCDEFLSPPPSTSLPPSPRTEHVLPLGVLVVRIKRGVNLAIRDTSGSSDPYVILRLGEASRKTRVVKRNLNPEWNEDFSHYITNTNIATQPVQLAVYDKDTFVDDKMGDAEFEIKTFVDYVRMQLEGIPEGTIIARVKPSKENCLSKESCIVCTNGKLVQNMFLRLRNVERGEVELELKWTGVEEDEGWDVFGNHVSMGGTRGRLTQYVGWDPFGEWGEPGEG